MAPRCIHPHYALQKHTGFRALLAVEAARDSGKPVVDPSSYEIEEATCSDCGALLWSREWSPEQGRYRTFVHDEVWRWLYTPQGIRELATEALVAKGIPIPPIWNTEDALLTKG